MSFVFRSSSDMDICCAQLMVAEDLLKEGCSRLEVGELVNEILEDNTQCLYRYCGTCNGVGCESSISVKPERLADAELYKCRNEYTDHAEEVSDQQARQWQYEEEGRCHW